MHRFADVIRLRSFRVGLASFLLGRREISCGAFGSVGCSLGTAAELLPLLNTNSSLLQRSLHRNSINLLQNLAFCKIDITE